MCNLTCNKVKQKCQFTGWIQELWCCSYIGQNCTVSTMAKDPSVPLFKYNWPQSSIVPQSIYLFWKWYFDMDVQCISIRWLKHLCCYEAFLLKLKSVNTACPLSPPTQVRDHLCPFVKVLVTPVTCDVSSSKSPSSWWFPTIWGFFCMALNFSNLFTLLLCFIVTYCFGFLWMDVIAVTTVGCSLVTLFPLLTKEDKIKIIMIISVDKNGWAVRENTKGPLWFPRIFIWAPCGLGCLSG